MIHYITYSDTDTDKNKVNELKEVFKTKNFKYGIINMNSLLSDFVKLGENDTDVILVTELNNMGDILKDAITPLIKNLSKIKEVYIFVSESEYKDKQSKLLRIDNE